VEISKGYDGNINSQFLKVFLNDISVLKAGDELPDRIIHTRVVCLNVYLGFRRCLVRSRNAGKVYGYQTKLCSSACFMGDRGRREEGSSTNSVGSASSDARWAACSLAHLISSPYGCDTVENTNHGTTLSLTFNLARPRLLVKTLGISPLGFLQRRIHKDLQVE
jgi:hypothetical protein